MPGYLSIPRVGSGGEGGTGGGVIFLASFAAVSILSVEIDLLTYGTTYDDFILVADDIVSATNGLLSMRFKIGGAIITANYRFHISASRTNAVSYTGKAASSDPSIKLNDGSTTLSNYQIYLSSVLSTTSISTAIIDGVYIDTTPDGHVAMGVGYNDNTGKIDAVEITNAVNMTGNFRLYGVVKT